MASRVKPAELEHALESDRGEPVYLVNAEGETTHVVLSLSDARDLLDQWLIREIQIGIDQIERGESEKWDVEALLAEAHRRHAEQKVA